MRNEWFRDWFNSPYYHLLYFKRNEAEAARFIDNLLAVCKPAAGSRMLDMGCGRGRHSRILADKGYQVTGLDLSPESIRFAKAMETPDLEFFIHDMRLPFRINYYDFVFSFFTSFGYFATWREHQDAIRTMATALKPGGLLMIDFLNVHYAEERLRHDERLSIDGINFEIHRWQDEQHFFKKIIVDDPQLPRNISFTEKVAKLTLGNFTDLLSYQGLQVESVYGNYQFESYDLHSCPRLIVFARKPADQRAAASA